MIYYLPLEAEEMRYTASLDFHITENLERYERSYLKINPQIPEEFDQPLPAGQFLNAPKTIWYKNAQLQMLANIYAKGNIKSGDTIFLSDMWFPGIEAIRYLDYFTQRDVKLVGILHAGTFTDTDFVRQLERWGSMQENVWFDMFDKIIVASDFIKNDVVQKRLVSPDKVTVTRFPLDWTNIQSSPEKENIVLFNGRLCGEKQPELFDWIATTLKDVPPDTQFIKTQEMGLSKDAYHALLGRAKVVVSFALQENFGFGIAEATMSGCLPVVPNRLVYPELYPNWCLYDSLQDAEKKLHSALVDYNQVDVKAAQSYLQQSLLVGQEMRYWFNADIKN